MRLTGDLTSVQVVQGSATVLALRAGKVTTGPFKTSLRGVEVRRPSSGHHHQPKICEQALLLRKIFTTAALIVLVAFAPLAL